MLKLKMYLMVRLKLVERFSFLQHIPFTIPLSIPFFIVNDSDSNSKSKFEFSIEQCDNNELLEGEFGDTQAISHEISCFLREPVDSDWKYLDKFPIIKKLHMKFNCIFCTEADVERMFSYAGEFETQLVLVNLLYLVLGFLFCPAFVCVSVRLCLHLIVSFSIRLCFSFISNRILKKCIGFLSCRIAAKTKSTSHGRLYTRESVSAPLQ